MTDRNIFWGELISNYRYRIELPEWLIAITETDLWEFQLKISRYRYRFSLEFQVISITDTHIGLKTNYHPDRKNYKRKLIKIPGFRFSLCWITKAKAKENLWILFLFVSVACCSGLCVPKMTMTKAKAKENLGEFICLSITKAKAKQNLQIFICKHFRADGSFVIISATTVVSDATALQGWLTASNITSRVLKMIKSEKSPRP